MEKYWFYMNKDTDVSKIKSVIDKEWNVEIWKEVGVLEISKDDLCMDVEEISIDRWDDFSKNYVMDNSYSNVYAVSLGEGDDNSYKKLMKNILENVGGVFVADTENFEPHFE